MFKAKLGLNIGSANAANVARPLPEIGPATPNLVWVHVDLHEPVHVTADARHLPFADQSFGVVHCAHLVEHVPLTDVVPLLRELRRVTIREGYGFFSGPDCERAYAAGSRMWNDYGIHGGVYYNGWQHQWPCDAYTLRTLLTHSGWKPKWALAVPEQHPANLHGWPVDFEARYLAKRDDSTWPEAFPQPARAKVQLQ